MLHIGIFEARKLTKNTWRYLIQRLYFCRSVCFNLNLTFYSGLHQADVLDKFRNLSTQQKNMQQVKKGDTVKVHYHGKLTNGTTFDSSAGREPLEFEVGSGMVIPGFDEGVTGMSIGDKKTIHIPADQAYGQKEEHMIMEFPRDRFPEDMVPEVGIQLNMSNGSGQNFPVVITEVRETVVVLDANHPLAGEDLVFDLELVAINGASSLIITP
jgi:FKBP-type peptidyl-prolyl cis-trans isomerase 2